MQTYRAHSDVSVLSDQLEVPGLGFLPVNAFVIHAAQPVVADTGLGLPDRDLLASLAEAIDPADIRWIWLTHPDRDHTGGLFALLDAARALFISAKTASVHVSNIMAKLGVSRRGEAAAVAHRLGGAGQARADGAT